VAAADIEWGKIGELLWAAPLAALAVTIAFSLIIVGSGRAADARREGAARAAAAFSVLAVTAALAFAGVVAYGIDIIVRK
jgi:hypothetical protein